MYNSIFLERQTLHSLAARWRLKIMFGLAGALRQGRWLWQRTNETGGKFPNLYKIFWEIRIIAAITGQWSEKQFFSVSLMTMFSLDEYGSSLVRISQDQTRAHLMTLTASAIGHFPDKYQLKAALK